MVQAALTPANQRFSISSNEYVCRAIQRRQIEDFIQPSPASGRQTGDSRFLRNNLIFGNVLDAYGGRTLGPWSLSDVIQDHLAHAHVHHFHDSECETRFGAWTAPREKNTLTMPTRGQAGTEKTSSIFGEAEHNSTQGGIGQTQQMYNDKPCKFFAGSSVTGLFCWEALSDTAVDQARIFSFAWTGAAFSAQAGTTIASAGDAIVALFDMEVHKGSLFAVGTNQNGTAAGNNIRSTTDGSTWADPGTEPVANAFLEGTRFIDDGNTLWLVAQLANKAVGLYKSTDAGATWTTVSTAAGRGQIRSVGKYFDRSLNSQLVVLTEDALYYIDQTNSTLARLQTLSYPGRAMIEWGGSLHIAMDGMRVSRYTQTEGATIFEDISPGRGEAMPSGKDFGSDTAGVVLVEFSSTGPYFCWSGKNAAGTLLRPLCLQFDGEGWHFIWRLAAASDVSYSARALALDPVSGDMLYFGANVVSVNEVRDHDTVRIIRVETDPRLLTANIYETAGYLETPLLSVDPVALSTTMWDMFYNTEGLTTSPATVSLQVQYGVNGAVATTANQTAQTTDRVTVGFGTNSVGVNFVTVRFRFVFVATATASPLVHAMELSYLKIPTVRWAYTLDVDILATVKEGGEQRGDYATVVSSLKTALGSSTKLTCVHPHEGTLYLMPVAPWQAAERFRGGYDVADTDSDAIWRVTLVDV